MSEFPKMYNLNPTKDGEGVVDVFMFYDEFNLDVVPWSHAVYLGGMSGGAVVDNVVKYVYNNGTAAFNRGSILIRRSQADCFKFGSSFYLLHGSSHAEQRHYHAQYARYLEIYDTDVDMSSMFDAVDAVCHSFRNASVNTEWFGVSFMGFHGSGAAADDNPMVENWYAEDVSYPRGGSVATGPVYKLKRPTTVYDSITIAGADHQEKLAGGALLMDKCAEAKAYLFGGRMPSNTSEVAVGHFAEAVRKADLTTDTFATTDATLHRGVEGCAGAGESDKIWIAGGVGAYTNRDSGGNPLVGKHGLPVNTVWRFDTGTGTCAVMPAKLPLGRGFGVASVDMGETKMVLAGGGDLNFNNWYDADNITMVEFATGTECVRCESTLGMGLVGHMGGSPS